MDDVWAFVTSPFKIPDEYPGAGAVLTGIIGLLLTLGGIVAIAAGAGEDGIAAVIPGLILLAMVIYAGAETEWFQRWRSPDPGHALARWIGPGALGITLILLALSIIVAIGAVIVIIFLAVAALGGS